MNFDGCTPAPITRFGGLVDQLDATSVPVGVSPVARNVRYALTGCGTRFGLQAAIEGVNKNSRITGLLGMVITPNTVPEVDSQVPLLLDSTGQLQIETPIGLGACQRVASQSGVAISAGLQMQAAQGQNRAYCAFSDFMGQTIKPAVYDPATGNLDPMTLKPFGFTWAKATAFTIGDVVTPTVTGGNGHTYRCVTVHVSGIAEPVWPTGYHALTPDGDWQELTMVVVQTVPSPLAPAVVKTIGGGAWTAGQDLYIASTYVNASGETSLNGLTVYNTQNLSGAESFAVTQAALGWFNQLPANWAVLGYNVYAASVLGGSAPPASAAYQLQATGIALGGTYNLTHLAAGVAPPIANAAVCVPAGNIVPDSPTGLRYFNVCWQNRFGSRFGWRQNSAVAVSVLLPNLGLFAADVATGPANVTSRVVIATQADQNAAGPYFFNAFDDVETGVLPVIPITKTVILDNLTSTITMSFTDKALAGGTSADNYFKKIEVVGAQDAFFSKTTQRMILTGVPGNPSAAFISLSTDLESFYSDTGILNVAVNDGQRLWAVREFLGVLYGLKSKSGHIIAPHGNEPSSWGVSKQWDKVGIVGPRAVDVGLSVMALVDRSGLHVFTGTLPTPTTRYIPKAWKKINWRYGHLIWVLVDEESKEVLVGVPWGKSTVPNKVIRVNFEEGWNDPIHFSSFSGKEVATGEAYKFSIDDIAAYTAARVERALPDLNLTLDSTFRESQILLASSDPTGTVNAIQPDTYNDNGQGIDCEYQTACPEEGISVVQLGGASANVYGEGTLRVSVMAGRPTEPNDDDDSGPNQKEIKLKDFPLTPDNSVGYGSGARGQNERLRLKFTNGKQADNWFFIQSASLYVRPLYGARTG